VKIDPLRTDWRSEDFDHSITAMRWTIVPVATKPNGISAAPRPNALSVERRCRFRKSRPERRGRSTTSILAAGDRGCSLLF